MKMVQSVGGFSSPIEPIVEGNGGISPGGGTGGIGEENSGIDGGTLLAEGAGFG